MLPPEKETTLGGWSQRQAHRPWAERPQLPWLCAASRGPSCSSAVAMAPRACGHFRLDGFCSSTRGNNGLYGCLDKLETLKSNFSFPDVMEWSPKTSSLVLYIHIYNSSFYFAKLPFVACVPLVCSSAHLLVISAYTNRAL